MYRSLLLLTLSLPAFATLGDDSGTIYGTLGNTFDGSPLNSALATSLAESDLLVYAHCDDPAGGHVDDCIVLVEVEAEDVYVIRVVEADACSMSETAGCHSGYRVTTEITLEVTDGSYEDHVLIGMEATLRGRDAGANPLEVWATSTATVDMTTSTRSIEVDFFAGGLWQGGDEYFTIAEGVTVDCATCGGLADFIEAAGEWYGSLAFVVWTAGGAAAGGVIGSAGTPAFTAPGTALGAGAGFTIGSVVRGVYRLVGSKTAELVFDACLMHVCELESADIEVIDPDIGFVEDALGGAANPLNDPSASVDPPTGTVEVGLGEGASLEWLPDGTLVITQLDGSSDSYPPTSLD